MIPILYKETEKDFQSNGIGHLNDTIIAEVREVLNGEYELYLEYPINGILADEIMDFRFIQAKPNDKEDEHAFRIYEIEKEDDPDTIRVRAHTKSNTLNDNTVSKVEGKDSTPEELLYLLKNNLILPTDYEFYSDITKTGDVSWEYRNATSCILGQQGSLVDVFGGELRRTNTHIYLYKRRGNHRVATIRQDRGIEGFRQTISTKGLTTKILPYAEIHPEGSDNSVKIEGDIVDSPIADRYPFDVIKPVDFSSDEDVIDIESLNAKASTYFTSLYTEADTPKVEVEINLYELSVSKEYKKFKDLESIGIGDTIDTWIEDFDIDVNVKVKEVVYDSLSENIISIVAGSKSTSSYSSQRSEYEELFGDREQEINNKIQIAANHSNRNFRGPTRPTSGMKKDDNWYEERSNGGIRLHKYDGSKWVLEKVSGDQITGTLDAASGDLDIINMNANNISANRGNFVSLALQDASSFTSINASGIRATHTDGSYTQLTNQGLRRFTSGDSRNYHYLIYATAFVYGSSAPNSTRWMQLPDGFKGKDFQVYLSVADSMNAIDYTRSIQRIVVTQHPNYSIDYKKAQVPIIAYKSETKGDGNAPAITDVQGVLLAIY